jgi:saccharopine dehydrogenase-like NADP-dependent oxidoreductase
MSHYLVLGAGKMGIALARDLIESGPRNLVTLVDINPLQLERAGKLAASSRLELRQGNMDIEEQRQALFKDKDLVLNALLHRHSLPTLETAVRSGAHFVDLAGEGPLARMAFDREARNNGVIVLSGMGLSPGITNVLVGRAVHLLEETDSALIYCGGNPVHPQPPLDYRIVYAIDSLINFYQRPALIIRHGRVEEVGPLTEVEPIGFPPDFPEMECFFTDGLSSLLHTMKGKIHGDLYEKTVRHRGHSKGIKTLGECGFFSTEPVQVAGQRVVPRQVSEALLEERMRLGEEQDVTLLRIVVSGKKSGVSQTHTFEMVDYADSERQFSSMARTTGYPASIAAQMIVSGRVSDRGVVFPEGVFDREQFPAFMEGLRKRGVAVSHRVTSD